MNAAADDTVSDRHVDKRLNVLIVDDDELVMLNMRRALVADSRVMEVVTASDGVEALHLLKSGAVPRRRLLVLVDLRMPRMTGIEMITALRDDPALAKLPVIVLTTSMQDEDREASFRLHVAGYLQKPMHARELRGLVEGILGYWTQVEFPVT